MMKMMIRMDDFFFQMGFHTKSKKQKTISMMMKMMRGMDDFFSK